jgi:hypothetical protein
MVTKTFFNRAARYVRMVMTITGTSPTPYVCGLVAGHKVSF